MKIIESILFPYVIGSAVNVKKFVPNDDVKVSSLELKATGFSGDGLDLHPQSVHNDSLQERADSLLDELGRVIGAMGVGTTKPPAATTGPIESTGTHFDSAAGKGQSKSGLVSVIETNGEDENKSLNDKTLKDKSLNDKTLKDKSLNDKSLNEKSLNEKVLNDKSLSEKSLNEKSLSEKSLNEKSLNERIDKLEDLLEEIVVNQRNKSEVEEFVDRSIVPLTEEAPQPPPPEGSNIEQSVELPTEKVVMDPSVPRPVVQSSIEQSINHPMEQQSINHPLEQPLLEDQPVEPVEQSFVEQSFVEQSFVEQQSFTEQVELAGSTENPSTIAASLLNIAEADGSSSSTPRTFPYIEFEVPRYFYEQPTGLNWTRGEVDPVICNTSNVNLEVMVFFNSRNKTDYFPDNSPSFLFSVLGSQFKSVKAGMGYYTHTDAAEELSMASASCGEIAQPLTSDWATFDQAFKDWQQVKNDGSTATFQADKPWDYPGMAAQLAWSDDQLIGWTTPDNKDTVKIVMAASHYFLPYSSYATGFREPDLQKTAFGTANRGLHHPLTCGEPVFDMLDLANPINTRNRIYSFVYVTGQRLLLDAVGCQNSNPPPTPMQQYYCSAGKAAETYNIIFNENFRQSSPQKPIIVIQDIPHDPSVQAETAWHFAQIVSGVHMGACQQKAFWSNHYIPELTESKKQRVLTPEHLSTGNEEEDELQKKYNVRVSDGADKNMAVPEYQRDSIPDSVKNQLVPRAPPGHVSPAHEKYIRAPGLVLEENLVETYNVGDEPAPDQVQPAPVLIPDSSEPDFQVDNEASPYSSSNSSNSSNSESQPMDDGKYEPLPQQWPAAESSGESNEAMIITFMVIGVIMLLVVSGIICACTIYYRCCGCPWGCIRWCCPASCFEHGDARAAKNKKVEDRRLTDSSSSSGDVNGGFWGDGSVNDLPGGWEAGDDFENDARRHAPSTFLGFFRSKQREEKDGFSQQPRAVEIDTTPRSSIEGFLAEDEAVIIRPSKKANKGTTEEKAILKESEITIKKIAVKSQISDDDDDDD